LLDALNERQRGCTNQWLLKTPNLPAAPVNEGGYGIDESTARRYREKKIEEGGGMTGRVWKKKALPWSTGERRTRYRQGLQKSLGVHPEL